MRVYEFSKESGIANKDLIKKLQEAGYNVQTHMAVLSPEALEFLKNKFQKKSEEKIQAKAEQPRTIKEENQSKKISELEKEKIEEEEKIEDHELAEEEMPIEEEVKKGVVLKPMTLSQLADVLQKPVNELILTLLKKGQAYNKNQILTESTIEQLAEVFGYDVIKEKEKISAAIPQEPTKILSKEQNRRLPVVVVMGHVDHGKTTLLDFIRKTRVAAREKGGITQHLGAYEVTTTNDNKMVFLDTPGHAAFSMMRTRGVRVADIAVIVVAVDDGVMPQSIEAIKVAQSKNIPIIIALNKIDKVEPKRIDEVKTQISKHGLLPEEWGGQTIYVPISAKTGTGVDQLLDMIILQSEVMDLVADEKIDACGYVLESKIEKGLGPVATFIGQHGILKLGNYFICGKTLGKVTVLIDSFGKRVTEAKPSVPVMISGFNELPQVGDYLQVVPIQEYQKFKADSSSRKTPQALKSIPEESINIILKVDNDSSKEAILGMFDQISKKSEKPLFLVYAEVGNINESDIINASTSKAIIYGFDVKLESNVLSIAQKHSVSIRLFDIIYKLFDDLQELTKSQQKVVYKKVKTGEAVIRKIFDIKGLGIIAGFYVKDGKIVKDGTIVVFRDNRKIGEGKIKSLQREKRTMKEISAGFEGAFLLEGFQDWTIEDRAECYIEVPVE